MRARIDNRYTEDFKFWCAKRYVDGDTMAQIAEAAQKAFPELRGSFGRNHVLGIVHRAGATTKKLAKGLPRMSDLVGGRMSQISLPGPEWSMPDLPNVRRAA